MPLRRKPPAQQKKTSKAPSSAALKHAVRIIYPICCLAGSHRLLDNVRTEGTSKPLGEAIEQLDTPALFDWLIRTFSFQGVSDRAAATYMDVNGTPTWSKISSRLARKPSCPKLQNYWSFHGCGYSKSKQSCACPDHFARCPLPKDRLRNGRLNQTAYSLYLFLRDVADGDLIGWIESQLRPIPSVAESKRLQMMREALLGPLRHVYGVGDKVLSMALASLLLAAPDTRTHWREIGGSMIAVDTLVHKFLHRTGILDRFGAYHSYGVACYQPNGCAEILTSVAARINAREFNRDYPSHFPRFVQHALWRWCAQDGLSICNSIRIKDRSRCANFHCCLFRRCDKRRVGVT